MDNEVATQHIASENPTTPASENHATNVVGTRYIASGNPATPTSENPAANAVGTRYIASENPTSTHNNDGTADAMYRVPTNNDDGTADTMYRVPTSVYLNIGSNRGPRHATIDRAVAAIAADPVLGAARIRRSPWVESPAWGYASDADFINLGVALDFDGDVLPCTPLQLLDRLQAIEQAIAPDSPHRNDDGTYRDRAVDIDIIDIDGVRIDSPRLTIPHPRAAARAFVMQPMRFLCPQWRPDTPVSHDNARVKKSIADMARDSVEAFKTKNKIPVAVVLDNIRSENNVGSVFRTADAFRMAEVVLCGISACPPSPGVHKTALGAEQSVAWRHFDDTVDAVRTLQSEGYTIVCLEQVRDSVSLDDYTPLPDRRYAIVAGNEVSGVSQAVVDMADVCVEIPQEGTKHSLNVAVSAALAMWTFFTKLR